MDPRRPLAIGFLALALCACELVGEGRRVPPDCEFPEGTLLTFAGETTMAELWIPAPGHEDDVVYAWVTDEPLMESGGRAYRVACVERGFRDYEKSAYPGSLFRP